MDFLSRPYLCVKLSLRLMHDIHSLINFELSILKLIKIYSEKMLIIFFARYLETMITYNNQIRFLKFVTLYSCTIELILEELKYIKWHLTSDIKKSGPHTCFSGIIFTIKCLIQTKFTQQQVNIQHFGTGILYLCKTEVNSLISMSEKKSAITFAQGCTIQISQCAELSRDIRFLPKWA